MGHYTEVPLVDLGAVVMKRRYLAFFLLALLISCGECQRTEIEKTKRSGVSDGCEPICELGTRRCADERTPAECKLDHDGCPSWEDLKTQVCQDIQWCYNGGCFNADTISLPETAPSDFVSIMPWTSHNVPLDPDITVIPYEAFINAIKMDQHFDAADEDQSMLAANVVMQGNDPNVLGVTALMQPAEEFEGDVFLVMVDPTYSPNQPTNPNSQTMALIESKRYFMAVMPGLRGQTSYVGTMANQRAIQNAPFPTTCCNDPSQPPQSGGFGQPGAGPLPDGPCPEDMPDCGFDGPLAQLIQYDPLKQPFRTGTQSQLVVDPDQISPKLQLRGNGMPAVFMYNSMGYDWHRNQFDHSPTGPLIPNASIHYPLHMKFHPAFYLDWCSQAICKEDPTPTDALDNNSASDLCGNATLGGHDVPEACKAMTPNPRNAHASCGGALFGMGGETLPTGLCHHTIGTGNLANGSNIQCGGDGMPSFCKWATQCEDFCDSTCQQNQKDFWREFYGCSGPGGLAPTGSASSNVTCTENGVCQTLSNGSEQCLECNESGGCNTTIKSNPGQPDSRYFAGGETKTKKRVYNPETKSYYMEDMEIQPSKRKSDGSVEKRDEGNTDQQNPKKESSTNQNQATTPKPVKKGEGKGTPTQPPVNNSKDTASPTDSGGSDDDQKRLLDVDFISYKYLVEYKPFEDPQAPKRKPTSTARTPNRGTLEKKGNTSKGEGDPVILASGSLSVEQVDLNYPGPVRALTFERYYDSGSDDRSILGSNWSHNYDMRIEPVTPGNIPDWAPKYCVATYPRLTCAFVHYPGDYSRLFVKSPGDPNNLFYPQAGSAETLRFDTDAWQLRNVEGHLWLFNEFGYLVQDRDRFGNGFSIVYEHTPLHKAFRYACLAKGRAFNKPVGVNPQGDTNPNATVDIKNYNRRTCRVLAAALGDQPEMEVSSNGFDTFDQDTNQPILDLPPITPNNATALSLSDWVYVQWWLSQDVNARPLTGEHKMRPKYVIDDLGRQLTFNYYSDVPQSIGPALPSTQGQSTYGLLKEVVGPDEITKITYQYQRPVQYPTGLQESFLTQVQRLDNVTGSQFATQSTKTLTMDYGWNTNANWLSAYDSYANDVYDRYLDYFGTFTGCNWYADGAQAGSGATVCTNGSSVNVPGSFFVCNNSALPANGNSTNNCWAPGASRQGHNPCYLARQEKERYISRLADNIQIIKRNNIVEVKSQYQANPDAQDFDRVTRQRYGGLTGPTDSLDWSASNEPEATFKYMLVKPTNGGQKDATTTQLPPEIADRYPLEMAPNDWEPLAECIVNQNCNENDANAPKPSCLGDKHTNAAVYNPETTCNSNNNLKYYSQLPGVFKTWKYFASTEANTPTQFPKLYRSRLTCDQLAARMIADPSHNGTMKRLNKGEHVWDHVVDDRANIEADLRRICAWVEFKDRDGDLTVSGLNFKGQAVVEANQVNGQWLIKETIVNADGLTVQSRNVRPATRDWQEADGYTKHEYAAFDGVDDQGNPTWRAFWWMKRFNRVETTEYPNTNISQPSFVHTYGLNDLFDGQSLQLRRTSLTYEPLFNQVQSVTSSVDTASGEQSTQQIIYDFDYQELDPDTPEFTEAVMAAHRWGLHLPPSIREMLDEDARQQGISTSWKDWLKAAHLDMTFYPNQDINGDGVMGFVNYAVVPNAAYSARGFPIRMTVINPQSDVSTPTFDQQKQSYIWPSPHGLPNRIISDDGTHTVLEYYSLTDTPYGEANPIADAPSGINYRGLLGRVLTQRTNLDYPEAQEGAFDSPLHQSVCQALNGPYQWLLPQGCAQGAQQALSQLGVPTEVQDELLDASNAQNNWMITTLSYNPTGHTHRIYSNGRTTTFVRDSDGRLIQTIDPLNNTVTVTRDLDGWPTLVEHKNAANQLLHKSHYQYDTEGRLLARCTVVDASSPNACGSFNWTAPIAVDVPRDTSSPTYLLETYRYSPEGLMTQSIDSMGHQMQYTHDARGLLTKQVLIEPNGNNRQTRWYYDNLGRKTRTQYGTDATYQAEDRDEYFAYDGFGRIVQYTDDSEVPWQLGWNLFNQLSAYKQDNTPYRAHSASTQPTATWEIFRSYDGFGRFTGQRTHNLTKASYVYGPMGYVRHIKQHPVADAQGAYELWLSYNAQGEVVWQTDQEGNQVFSTWDPVAQRQTQTQIRVGNQGSSNKNVTAQMIDMDLLGHPKTQTILGQHGETQITQATFSPRGYLENITNPLGHMTSYQRNLLGWPTQVAQPNGQQEASSVSTYLRNAYGQILQITEPGTPGGVTKYTYNRFGELETRELPHAQGFVHDAFVYDGYGRLSQHQQYDNGQLHKRLNIQYQRQPNGVERVRTVLDSTNTDLTTHEYDAFGRLIFAESNNTALQALLGQPLSTRARVQYQHDPLGRVTSETQSVYEDSTLLWQNTTQSSYQVNNQGHWQRQIIYPSGSVHTRQMDALGRLKRITESSRQGNTINALATDFDWLGGLYAGRNQQYHLSSGNVVPDPINEARQFDGLARHTQIQYNALSFGPSNQPTNTAWAQQYCQGTWTNDCGQHLVNIEMKYDLLSQLKSVRRRFDHPMFNGSNQLLSNTLHKAQWKGYQYNARGHLKGQWHIDDLSESQHNIIQNHSMGTTDLEQVGYPNGQGHKLDFNREQGVGDLLSITRADNNDVLWAHKNAQGQSSYYKSGHQFEQIEVDGTGQHPINYDGRGRITQDTDFEYAYDEFDRLIAARPIGQSTWAETYIYDGVHRLVATTHNNQTKRLIYDDVQMVAGYQDNQLTWEAIWGPKLDQLLLWRDVVNNKDYIPLTDHRNNVVSLYNASEGQVAQLLDWSATGRLRLMGPDEQNLCQEEGTGQICQPLAGAFPFGFNTSWRSSVTGLNNMRMRWYSPKLGSFTTQDPLEYIDSYNMYAFAGFDPINGWDPFGLSGTGFAQKAKETLKAANDKRKKVVDSLSNQIKKNVPKSVLEGSHTAGRAVGDFFKAVGDGAEKALPQRTPKDSKLKEAKDVVARTAIEIYRTITPQDGDKALEDAAITIATLGIGPAASAAKKGAKSLKKALKKRKNPKSLKLSPCPKSFAENTQVMMCDGTSKNIQDIKKGDMVLSKDPETGQMACKPVVATHLRTSSDMYQLTVIDAQTKQQSVIFATVQHPFYVVGKSTPVRVSDLIVGDIFWNLSNKVYVLQRVKPLTWSSLAYNLTVEDFHTYFIEHGLWVQNCYNTTLTPNSNGTIEVVLVHPTNATHRGMATYNPKTETLHVDFYTKGTDPTPNVGKVLLEKLIHAGQKAGNVSKITGNPMAYNAFPFGTTEAEALKIIHASGQYKVFIDMGYKNISANKINDLNWVLTFSK